MSSGWVQHLAGILYFLAVILIVALTNLRYMRALGSHGSSVEGPCVSVLVPARDEEDNIERCVLSLLAQEYGDFEVLVLDDRSTDRTGEILLSLSRSHPRLRVITGEPLPDGWIGKHWACSKLAEAAHGDLLLFTDADTRHAPETLRCAVADLEAESLDLITAFPREEVVTLGEKVTVPILGFSMMAFMPLGLAYRLKSPGLAAAVGQFMLFRREAYEAVGGHEAVREYVSDDFALARNIKAGGFRWRFYEARRYISCRMYRDFREAFTGLSKNLFSAFGYRVLLFLFVWCWLGVVFLEPPIVLALGAAGVFTLQAGLILAGVEVALSLLLWLVTLKRLGFPAHIALLYPAIIATAIVIAMNSLRQAVSGSATWKGRTLGKKRVHL